MTNKKIANHYDDFFECYRHWSCDESAGYHFGIARKLSDIFSNRRMLQNASEMVFSCLELDFSKEVRILDAGCGAGNSSRFLIKKFSGKNIKVFGVTVSKRQLDLGQKLNKKAGFQNKISLSLNDFEKLPFKNGYFDAVFFQDSICYGSEDSKEKTINEIARVLRPGGRIALTDGFVFPRKKDFFVSKVDGIVKKSFAVEKWAVEEDFIFALEKNGFDEIKKQDLTWRSGPSIAQTIYFKVPKVFLSFLRKRLGLKDLVYTIKVAIFVPILGLHPYFKYQLISARKKLAK